MPAGKGVLFGGRDAESGVLVASHLCRCAAEIHATDRRPRRLGEMNERSFGHEYAIALAIGYLPGSGREAPAWAYGLY